MLGDSSSWAGCAENLQNKLSTTVHKELLNKPPEVTQEHKFRGKKLAKRESECK